MKRQLVLAEGSQKNGYLCIPWGVDQERCNRALKMIQFNTALHQYSDAAAKLGVKRFGRPTKYQEEFCALAYYMLADTRVIFTLKGVAAQLGISYDTLNYWQHRYPDFCHALTQGKAVQECWLATCLMHDWGNSHGIFIILRNLHGWRVNGRRSDRGSDLRQALEAQASGARRVEWDRISNEPHINKRLMPVSNTLHPKQ